MNPRFLAIFVLLISISVPGIIMAQSQMGAYAGESVNTWQNLSEEGIGDFWVDLNDDSQSDIHYLLLGKRYARVTKNSLGNQLPEWLVLLDETGNYRHFRYDKTETVFRSYFPSTLDLKNEEFESLRKGIVQGVQRRIYFDDHPDQWKQAQQNDLPNTDFQQSLGAVKRLYFRFTKTPAASADDPGRALKPIVFPDKSISLIPGQPADWQQKDLKLSGTLAEGLGGNIPADLHFFFLLFPAEMQGRKTMLLQIFGTLKIADQNTATFSTIIETGDADATQTVPLMLPGNKEGGALFIEILQHP